LVNLALTAPELAFFEQQPAAAEAFDLLPQEAAAEAFALLPQEAAAAFLEQQPDLPSAETEVAFAAPADFEQEAAFSLAEGETLMNFPDFVQYSTSA
jgi:hypothetical protein